MYEHRERILADSVHSSGRTSASKIARLSNRRHNCFVPAADNPIFPALRGSCYVLIGLLCAWCVICGHQRGARRLRRMRQRPCVGLILAKPRFRPKFGIADCCSFFVCGQCHTLVALFGFGSRLHYNVVLQPGQ